MSCCKIERRCAVPQLSLISYVLLRLKDVECRGRYICRDTMRKCKNDNAAGVDIIDNIDDEFDNGDII